ncbi:MAG: ABC transporter permease, partial [Brevundimonas sp.]|nr:ABC transporter permease [Brevundimonas sp.]
MNRVLLIARREFAAYAKTVGFWLSLLAFPLIIVLAGGLGFLTATSQPARAIAVVEEGAGAEGLAAVVQDVLRRDSERRAASLERAGKAASASGIPVRQNPIMASVGRERIRLV